MENQNNNLQTEINYANLSLEDIRKLYEMKEKNTLLEKYNFPSMPSSDGYYHIYVKDVSKKSGRKAIKDKTLSGLQEKILLHEKGISGSARKKFKDVFEIVQTEKLRYIKDSEKVLSVKNTIGRNKSEYKRFFGGTDFEKKYLDEITKHDIEAIVLANLNQYELHKKGLASMRAILKSVFDLSFSEYWIKDNPYLRVDFKKYTDMIVPSVPVSARVHCDTELQQMLDYIHMWQKKKPSYIPAYALEMQMICGMRRGEIPPLLWDNATAEYIEISREQLTIKRQGDIPEHFEIVSHTKNGKSRKFPMTDDLQEFMTRLKFVHETYYPNSKFLFPADTDNGCITNNHIYNFYRRMCKKIGIEISKDIIKGTHAFRRTRITEVINKTNGNVIMASKLFGNTPNVAEQNYFTGINLETARMVLNQ